MLVLSKVDTFFAAIPALLIFGAVMGMIDVVANIHAVIVEKESGRRLMSGMHALWSVGGFAGAGIFGVWLKIGLTRFMAMTPAPGGVRLPILHAFSRTAVTVVFSGARAAWLLPLFALFEVFFACSASHSCCSF